MNIRIIDILIQSVSTLGIVASVAAFYIEKRFNKGRNSSKPIRFMTTASNTLPKGVDHDDDELLRALLNVKEHDDSQFLKELLDVRPATYFPASMNRQD